MARKGADFPLYWGADRADGDSLMICTVPAYLSPFPPGCAFEVSTPTFCTADAVCYIITTMQPVVLG